MNISEEELKEKFDRLTDEELLGIWTKNTLIDAAKAVLRQELQHRGINPPEPNDAEQENIDEIVEPWVTVAQLTTGPEAHILRARLESENIPAIVADEHLVTANWFLSNAVGGVRVRVPLSFVEQANEIVTELESGKLEISDTEEDKRFCPKCSSDNVIEYKRSWKISFLIFYLFHIPMPYYANQYKCQDCGHLWKESPRKGTPE
ncbi:MAG: DUF2007 domain-containing protein [Thioalkalispiraceae bacterium]